MNPALPLSFLLAVSLCGLSNQACAADNWSGRKLSAVIEELRAAGLPLLYSSQVVGDELVIGKDPDAVLQLDRLRAALREFDLDLQSLEPAAPGYAIVRRQHTANELEPNLPAQKNKPTDELNAVTVFASRYNLAREEISDGSTYVPHANLEKTAGIEQDVLRSLQYLPGTSANSLSTLTHVRGGYEDENLIRFDGVELYNPVHLKDFQGLFGLLDPDWVQSLNFYSGAYPVQFGNHLAAVVDITPRSTAEREYTLSASLLYTRLLSTGSHSDEAGHWLLGYRRSNVAEVMRHTERNIGEPEFEDLIVRHSYQLGNGELRIGALRLTDDLQLQTDEQDQQASVYDHDTYLWLGWQQTLSDSLNYTLQLNHTQLSNRRSASLTRDNINNGTLTDYRGARRLTLNSQINLQSGDHTQWQAGMQLSRGEANYYYASNANYLTPLRNTFGKPASAQQLYTAQLKEPDYAGYVSVAHRLNRWRGELGLRYDVFPYLSHGTQFSPRLNMQYALSVTNSLHLSAGRYVQAQDLHTLDSSAETPRFYAPESMQQYILGWTYALSPELQLRMEAYHKHGSRLAPRSENLLSFITLASELEIDRNTITPDRSRAQGVEVSLTAPAQRAVGWWLNYSWSRVQDRIDGRYVRRAWDQPHTFTGGANWNHARWLLSGSVTWHSGWAYTPLTLTDDASSATLGARNSQRYADFVSLELRAQYNVPVRGAELQLFLELRNALNRKNQCCRELTVDTGSGIPSIAIDNQAALTLIPIAGFNLKF